MEMNIIKNEKNAVLNRQEIIAEVEEKITPTRETIQEKLAAQLNIPKQQIVIIKMNTQFGTNKTTIEARAYESEEQMKSVEAKYIQKRNFKEQPKEETTEEPKEENGEAVAEEKPAEPTEEVKEVKEEKVVEEAKEKPIESTEEKKEETTEKSKETVEEKKE